MLKAVFKDYHLEEKLLEVRLKEAWPKLMGLAVSRYTDDVRLQKGLLSLRFSSAVMRDQFRYSQDQLREKVNEFFGSEVVRKININ